jgi:hypothetical protein
VDYQKLNDVTIMLASWIPGSHGPGKRGMRPLLSRKKKAKKSVETYKICISKVLKQVYPYIGVSSKAMSIMKLFIIDIFKKLAKATPPR